MFVSVQNCDDLEFVRQFFKVFNEISRQEHQYLERRVHPKNGGSTQVLIKLGTLTNFFFKCNNARWKPKIRKIAVSHKRGILFIFLS